MFSTQKNKKILKITKYLLILSICSSSANSFSWSMVHYLKSRYIFYLVISDWKVYQYQKLSVTCVPEILYHKWTSNVPKTVQLLMNLHFAVCIYELGTILSMLKMLPHTAVLALSYYGCIFVWVVILYTSNSDYSIKTLLCNALNSV